jgi:dCMP deaminase
MTESSSPFKPHWHHRFLSLATHIAQWSRDPNRKVGSVIVRPDKTVASLGFNGFPRGVSDDVSRYQDRELKNEMVVHAEMNAILHAREPLHGYTLYVWPFHPCSRCAAAIIQAGIKHVVTVPWETTNWGETIRIAARMLDEAGITLTIFEDDLDMAGLFASQK